MTQEEDTPLHRGVEWWEGGGGEGFDGGAGKGGIRGEPEPQPPWVLPVVPCQWAAGHAPHPPPPSPFRLWRGGKWVVEVWPLITSSRRDHSPPQGLCGVALFSVVERKKKRKRERRNYLLFFSDLAGQQHSSAGRGASALPPSGYTCVCIAGHTCTMQSDTTIQNVLRWCFSNGKNIFLPFTVTNNKYI